MRVSENLSEVGEVVSATRYLFSGGRVARYAFIFLSLVANSLAFRTAKLDFVHE